MAPVTRRQEQKENGIVDDVKITLFWLEKSRAQRILWLLEELQLPYELKTFKRKNMLAPPELKEVHPLGKSPVISISSTATDNKPIVIAESSNIIEYLIDHFGQNLKPKQWKNGKEGQVGGETESWLRYRYFLHYAEGSLMPYLVMALIFRAMRDRSPFFVRPITTMMTGAVESSFLNPTAKTNLEFLENQLSTSPDGGDFFCGRDLSGADIAMSFPLQSAKGRVGLTKEKYPKLWDFIDRLEEREAYKRSVERIVEIEGAYDPKL